MRPMIALAVLGTLSLILAFLVLPATACGCKLATKATACLSNVRQQSLGLLAYSTDADDQYPHRDLWMDGIRPYVKGEGVLHDPEVPKAAYGYAFNAALSRAKTPKVPENVPLVYDSVNPIRNASDRLTSLALSGRHKGRNNVAYADGHTRAVPARPVVN